MEYLRRVVDDELDDLLAWAPATLLDGPRAVGKTTTALQRVADGTVFRLDDPETARVVAGNPTLVVGPMVRRPVLIDEWQRVPEVWDVVRRAVDGHLDDVDQLAPGDVLLTGSDPFADVHSGAGRIVSVRMRPRSIAEASGVQPTVSLGALLSASTPPRLAGASPFDVGDYVNRIVRGGMPGMHPDLPDREIVRWWDGYLERIVTRDFDAAGSSVRRPAALRAWLRAYAATVGTDTSWSKIRGAATPGDEHEDRPARGTTEAWQDVLETLRIIDPLPAWEPSGSRLTRLKVAPRHHLADPAMAAALLGVTARELVTGSGVPVQHGAGLLGALFESLAVLHVRVVAQQHGARVFHLRQRSGRRDVDMVVERGDGRVIGMEVKAAAAPGGATGHLRWLRDELGDRFLDGLVITTGHFAFRDDDGFGMVPLGLLGP